MPFCSVPPLSLWKLYRYERVSLTDCWWRTHLVYPNVSEALNTSKYLPKAKMSTLPEKRVFLPFCLYRSGVKRVCGFALHFHNYHYVWLSEREHRAPLLLETAFWPRSSFHASRWQGYFMFSGTWEKWKGQTSLCSPELREESLKPKATLVALPAELFPTDSHSNHAWYLLIFN